MPPSLQLDCISDILSCVNDEDLVALRAVSRGVKDVVEGILHRRFLERWGVTAVEGPLPPGPVLAACKLRHWAVRHHLKPRQSLASVALAYNVDTHILRRCNNVMSEHTLASRDHVFVPVQDAATLRGQTACFVFCRAARRHWMEVCAADSDEGTGEDESASSFLCSSEQARAKLVGMMQRALGIDTHTAVYYIESADGNIKSAMAAFEDDKRWDRCMRHLRKSLVSAGRRSS